MTNAEKGAEIFKQFIGKEEPPGEWFQVDQARINQFADCTLDHQFIHVDPEASAKLSPYKVTIAHGFLTLSLLTHLASTVKAPYIEGFAGIVMGVNYGFEKVRFPSPVKVNAKIRMRREISAVDLKDANSIQLTQKCTVEVDGETKPACVAEWLTRLVYG
jgi:acyl dehydratase